LVVIPLLGAYLIYERKHCLVNLKRYLICLGLAFLGCTTDYTFSYFGLIQFSLASFLPFWLILLWLCFSISLPVCYSWAIKFPRLIILFGGFLGPLTYWGGSKVSEVEILSPIYFSLSSAIFWAGLFALIFNSKVKNILFNHTN